MKTGLVINGSDVCANETFYLCNINPNVFDYGKFRDLLESMTINSVYVNKKRGLIFFFCGLF